MTKHNILAVGQKFNVRPGGTVVTVVAYRGAKDIDVQDSDGNQRTVTALELRRGTIRWYNADGSLYKSKRTPPREPDAPVPKRVRKRKVSEPKAPVQRRQEPDGYYVYVVTLDNVVVYVGQGKGDRWRHCYSGQSNNRELNRLYFEKRAVFVEVVQQGLDRRQSVVLERELIARYQPYCNRLKYTST